MIAKISNIQSMSSISGKISYNQDKVEKGVAILLFDNTMSSNKTHILNTFKEVLEKNKNVRKNFALEIVLSLPPSESISDDKFENIMHEYIKELGYENAPLIAYKHDDAAHKHLHIYVSQITWDGQKISDSNSKFRSLKITRALEEKYDLRKTETTFKVTSEALNIKNARKYYVQKALQKALKSYNTKTEIEKRFTEKELTILKTRNLPNEQVLVLLGKRRAEVMQFLEEKKMYNVILKDELYKDAHKILEENKDAPLQFLEKLQESGIYVRKVYDKKTAEPYFVYGIKDVSFYIEDKKLGNKFTYSALIGSKNKEKQQDKKVNPNKEFDVFKQRKFLERTVSKHLKTSHNLDGLSKRLQEDGVELITYQNSGGIFGVAYKSLKIDNAEVIKGSDIHISWNDIEKTLAENKSELSVEFIDVQQKEEKEIVHNSYTPYIPDVKLKGRNEDEDDRIRKGKKKTNKNGLSR